MSLPFCSVSIVAIASALSARRSPQAMSSRPRRVGDRRDHAPSNASAAARTARSMSARLDSAKWPHSFPVVGLVDVKVRPSAAGQRLPPMWLS
jgi:hypothetical protein